MLSGEIAPKNNHYYYYYLLFNAQKFKYLYIGYEYACANYTMVSVKNVVVELPQTPEDNLRCA